MKFNTSVIVGIFLASSGEVFCSYLLGRQPVEPKYLEIAKKSSEESAKRALSRGNKIKLSEIPQEIEMSDLFHQGNETSESPSSRSSQLYELTGKPNFTDSLFENSDPQKLRTYTTSDDIFSTLKEDFVLKQEESWTKEPATTQAGIPNPSTVPFSFSNMFLTPMGEFPYRSESVTEQASNPQGIKHVENDDVVQEDNKEDVVEVGTIDEPQNGVVTRNDSNPIFVLLNGAGKVVNLDPESKEEASKALKEILFKSQNNMREAQKMFGELIKLLKSQDLNLFARLDGRELRPIDENALVSLFKPQQSKQLMIENDLAENVAKDSSEIMKLLKRKAVKDYKKESGGILKPTKGIEAHHHKSPKPIAAATTVISEDTLHADPSISKFPWKTLLLLAGGLALVAAIVSAVYMASQTIQDEESVDL